MNTERDVIMHQRQMLEEENEMVLGYFYDDDGKKVTLRLNVEWTDDVRDKMIEYWEDFSNTYNTLARGLITKIEG